MKENKPFWEINKEERKEGCNRRYVDLRELMFKITQKDEGSIYGFCIAEHFLLKITKRALELEDEELIECCKHLRLIRVKVNLDGVRVISFIKNDSGNEFFNDFQNESTPLTKGE